MDNKDLILAVGIGNTNIRAALGSKASGGGSVRVFTEEVLPTDKINSSDDFTCFIKENFPNGAAGAIVSSVVPEKTRFIVDALFIETSSVIQRVDSADCSPLDISGYVPFLGEDRIACLAGALNRYSPPFMLVDFGTASTVNIVGGDNKFIGGAILTGVGICLKALTESTAQLPLTKPSANIPLIGKNTEESLLSGAVVGLAYAVEGYARYIKRELNRADIPVIVTGGYSQTVLPYCEFENFYEPGILPEGLVSLYRP